jgi:hypothetical protein
VGSPFEESSKLDKPKLDMSKIEATIRNSAVAMAGGLVRARISLNELSQ